MGPVTYKNARGHVCGTASLRATQLLVGIFRIQIKCVAHASRRSFRLLRAYPAELGQQVGKLVENFGREGEAPAASAVLHNAYAYRADGLLA